MPKKAWIEYHQGDVLFSEDEGQSMSERFERAAHGQYSTSERLRVRMETHRLYGERKSTLDDDCYSLMKKRGLLPEDSIVDVGCGTGAYLAYLIVRGHQGKLTGLDRSLAMIDEARGALSPARRDEQDAGQYTDERNKGQVDLITGDAQMLPFLDSSFDWAIARHVLFFVENIPRALAELGRVLRPGGRLLVTTNASASHPKIESLHGDLLRAFGYRPVMRPTERFGVENAKAILDSEFGEVEEVILEGALVFPDPEPLVRYISSFFPQAGVPDDNGFWRDTWPRMRDWLRKEANRRFVADGGRWRDPSRLGIYLCSRPRS